MKNEALVFVSLALIIFISCSDKRIKSNSNSSKDEQLLSDSAQKITATNKIDNSKATLSSEVKEQTLISEYNIHDLIQAKVHKLVESETFLSSKDSINEDFLLFYNKFISDSIFQIKHIRFPVLAVFNHCEKAEILRKDNWVYIVQPIDKFYKDEIYTFEIISTDQKFFQRSKIKEIGTISQIGFEKINGVWYLTLFEVNLC